MTEYRTYSVKYVEKLEDENKVLRQDVLEAQDTSCEAYARIEKLEAVVDWFLGVGLDWIPNDIYHKGGRELVAALETETPAHIKK